MGGVGKHLKLEVFTVTFELQHALVPAGVGEKLKAAEILIFLAIV